MISHITNKKNLINKKRDQKISIDKNWSKISHAILSKILSKIDSLF